MRASATVAQAMSRTHGVNHTPSGRLATISPLLWRFARLGSRLWAMRSMVSLCRQRWRSFSSLKCAAGLARHCSSCAISRRTKAWAERPLRHRTNSRIAASASSSLSREMSAHVGLDASG